MSMLAFSLENQNQTYKCDYLITHMPEYSAIIYKNVSIHSRIDKDYVNPISPVLLNHIVNSHSKTWVQ